MLPLAKPIDPASNELTGVEEKVLEKSSGLFGGRGRLDAELMRQFD
jgi:hypothetical protein